MHETYLSKIDECIKESIPMLNARNIEFIEKLLDVRQKTCLAYDDNYAVMKTTRENEEVKSDKSLTKHLIMYKDDKQHKRATSMTYLEYFMEELSKEFECISDLTADCDKERILVKNKIKEIFSLFA